MVGIQIPTVFWLKEVMKYQVVTMLTPNKRIWSATRKKGSCLFVSWLARQWCQWWWPEQWWGSGPGWISSFEIWSCSARPGGVAPYPRTLWKKNNFVLINFLSSACEIAKADNANSTLLTYNANFYFANLCIYMFACYPLVTMHVTSFLVFHTNVTMNIGLKRYPER